MFFNIRLPKFCSPLVPPDSTFSRSAGAPPEIEDLFREWCRCSGDWDWCESTRGRYVDYRLEEYERSLS